MFAHSAGSNRFFTEMIDFCCFCASATCMFHVTGIRVASFVSWASGIFIFNIQHSLHIFFKFNTINFLILFHTLFYAHYKFIIFVFNIHFSGLNIDWNNIFDWFNFLSQCGKYFRIYCIIYLLFLENSHKNFTQFISGYLVLPEIHFFSITGYLEQKK